jgi:hypothetical protein
MMEVAFPGRLARIESDGKAWDAGVTCSEKHLKRK